MSKIQCYNHINETIITSFGQIVFDGTGTAIVDQDVATEMLVSFPGVFTLIPEANPQLDTPIDAETPVPTNIVTPQQTETEQTSDTDIVPPLVS